MRSDPWNPSARRGHSPPYIPTYLSRYPFVYFDTSPFLPMYCHTTAERRFSGRLRPAACPSREPATEERHPGAHKSRARRPASAPPQLSSQGTPPPPARLPLAAANTRSRFFSAHPRHLRHALVGLLWGVLAMHSGYRRFLVVQRLKGCIVMTEGGGRRLYRQEDDEQTHEQADEI